MPKLSDQDLNKIKDLHNLWIAKELAGNECEVVDLCTEDIQWMCPDGPPIVGKEEIRKYLATNHVKLLLVDTTDVCVHGSGSVAYLTSSYSTRYLNEDHSDIEHEARGTHLWVLRKEDDAWRIAVVTWSSW